MASGDIKLSSNFELNSQRALDARINVASIAERDDLPTIQRYDRMIVSVRGGETYQMKLGTVDFDLANNLNWFSIDISAYLKLQAIVDSYGLTGFVDGENINVSYDFNTRTITLTGNLTYYFRGTKKELTSPWTSPVHANTIGKYFLYSTDGINFIWSNTPWSFIDVMVSFVNFDASASLSFALRETHGLMDQATHNELHNQIGTYKVSGGIVTAGTYLENSAIDTSITPGFDASVVKDEDLLSNIGAWIQGNYTLLHIGATSKATFTIDSLFPFLSTGSFLQINAPLAGTMANGIGNRYYNVYQIIVPATSDAASQKYRTILLQPQVAYTSLAAAQSEDIRGLSMGDLANLITEFVFHARITYITATGDTNTGKCRIATNGITYLSGSKANQVSIAGFTTNNHATLSSREWLISEHIGSPNTIAGFGVNGETIEIPGGQRAEILVANEAQFISAYTSLNTTYSGGTIRFIASFGLTQNHSFDHDGINVECGYFTLSMNGFDIYVNGDTCYYNNGFFDSVVAGSKFIFVAGVVSTNYVFYNCRFHRFLEAGSAEVFDLTAVVGSSHLFLRECWVSGAVAINTYAVRFKVAGSMYADIAITGCRSRNVATQTNIFGLSGLALPSAGAFFLYDTSCTFVNVLTPTGIYNILAYGGSYLPLSGGTIDGNLYINGNIIQNGAAYETHAEQIFSEKDTIILRDGAVSGLAVGVYSGFKIIKYNGTNNLIFATDRSGIARIGDEGGALQALATREDTPIDGGYARWNATTFRFETVNLSGVFAPLVHTHDYAASSHTHPYAALVHTHDYAATNHTHSGYQTTLTNPVTGVGTTNYLAKFTGASTIGNSLIFDNGSNVGINTISPDSRLHVIDSYGSGLRIGYLTDGFNYYDAVQHNFRNSGGAANVLTIIASGNIGIGLTDPNFKLTVKEAISVRDTSLPKYQLYVNSTPKGSLFFSGSYVGLYTLSNDNGLRIYEDGHSTFPGTVTAADFIINSDIRLKKNIKDINFGVSLLKPKSYIFKNDKFSGIHYGFIAQDMIIDHPDLVQMDNEGMLSIKQQSIIAMLVYQVNQQEQRINELTNLLNTTK